MNSYNTPALKRDLANYISGYVDGEGCFSVSFSIRPKLLVGWEVKPSFCVGQNYDRREVLDLMCEYFDCGHIRRDWSDRTLKYEVRRLDDLITKIIPHFRKFPLLSAKQKDFLLFAEICERVRKLEHRKKDTLRKIMRDAYRMNGSGKRKRPLETLLHSLEMKI
ncbi:MAG: LAGLIDADG family homing endonuclease [Ktedonobacteraceae bacterium]